MKHLFVGTVEIIAAYFALTWFLFGSPHPCGILEARQRPHLIDKARADSREDRRLALDLIKSMQPEAIDAGISMFETLNDLQRSVPIDLQRKIALMTPAECAWQAITWSPPKVAVEEQPAKIPPGYRALRPDEEILPLDAPLPPAPGGAEK
jgi:hypothetical protein